MLGWEVRHHVFMKVFHIINIANMELEGTISVVMAPMSGVSKATGNQLLLVSEPDTSIMRYDEGVWRRENQAIQLTAQ